MNPMQAPFHAPTQRARRIALILFLLAGLAGCATGPALPVQILPAPAGALELTRVHAHSGQGGIDVTGFAARRQRSLQPLPGAIRISAHQADGREMATRCVRWGPTPRRRWQGAAFSARLRLRAAEAVEGISVQYVPTNDCGA